MSTLTAEHDSYLVENWNTKTLINFLKKQNLKLKKKYFNILCKKELLASPFLT